MEPRERKRALEEEKAISWVADEKEDWGREEEMEIDHRKLKLWCPSSSIDG